MTDNQYHLRVWRRQLSLRAHVASQNFLNIALDNGFLSDGTEPLPEPMLTYHHWRFVAPKQFYRNTQDIYPWYACEN